VARSVSAQSAIRQRDADVRLEVLDWGGRDRPVVLIPGLGNTAHVFDDFAPKLARDYHVYGITRRGFGHSTIATAGYEADRLGDDIMTVLDAVKLKRPVLAAHSFGGAEVSSIATRHPERVAGVVYLDAAYEYAFHSETAAQFVEELPRRLQSIPPAVSLGPDDLKDFAAFRAFGIRVNGFSQPESELRQCCDDPDLTPTSKRRTPSSVIQAIQAGAKQFGAVHVPVLAVFASPHDYEKGWPEKTPAIDAVLAWERSSTEAIIAAFQAATPQAKVVRFPANHYVFISNEADVLRELRGFVSRLR
jgi:pimeloyl-ACP methyl ester carboxylesterase